MSRIQAEELWSIGSTLQEKKDFAGALYYFRLSIEIQRSQGNIRNAAVCLDHLERYDEAVEMYEEVLRDYRHRLDPQTDALITKRVNELRKHVGRIQVDPDIEGMLFIDGRDRGALPRVAPLYVMGGKHRIRVVVVQHGSRPFETSKDVEVLEMHEMEVSFPLPPPPSPPRPRPPALPALPEGWFLGSFGGYAIGPSLGSDTEADVKALDTCGEVCPSARGFLLGARGGYLFDFKLALEVTFGFVALSSVFNREETVTFHLQDDVRFQGGVGGVGVSYRWPIVSFVDLLGRMTVGLISARSASSIDASAAAGGNMVPAFVGGRSQVLASQPGFIMPEVGVDMKWRGVRIGVVVGLLFVTSDGPAYGPFQVSVPQITLGYLF